MITVKFLGGAKRSFQTDKLEIDKGITTVAALLEHIQRSIPKDKPALDISNILVAVNGIDSSALAGNNTNLKDGDVISIIPVIHGGSSKQVSFKIGTSYVELVRLKIDYDPINFLEDLRNRHPDLAIQGIMSKYIVSIKHAKKVIAISLAAKQADVLLSNRIETDLLMRFAFTRQINDAIKKLGLQQGQDAILVVIGKKSSVDKLSREIKHLAKPFELPAGNASFVKKEFGINKKQLGCIISKNPLEDILAEKAAVLFH